MDKIICYNCTFFLNRILYFTSAEGVTISNSKSFSMFSILFCSSSFKMDSSRAYKFLIRCRVYKNRVYTVIKARCRGRWSYRTWPGQTLLLDTYTGYEIYVDGKTLCQNDTVKAKIKSIEETSFPRYVSRAKVSCT